MLTEVKRIKCPGSVVTSLQPEESGRKALSPLSPPPAPGQAPLEPTSRAPVGSSPETVDCSDEKVITERCSDCFLFVFIDFVGVALVNKIVWISDAQFYSTASAQHRVLRPKSSLLPSHVPLTFVDLPSGNHRPAVCVHASVVLAQSFLPSLQPQTPAL